jgi:spore coat polysaccharide biosynthesis predicted glycosyltransferase SpsG
MVLCWTEAGPRVGFGHLSRVLALVEALEERGIACRVALPPDPTALAWLRIAGARAPIVLADEGPALPQVLDAAREAAAVIVDVRHPLTRAEVRALGAGRPVVIVDNAGPGATEADLVVAPFGVARDPRWLDGAAHVPLRRAFRLGGELRGPRGGSPLVLISMGASDPEGLTLLALDGLALARERVGRFTVRVLANPASPLWSRLPAWLRRLDFPPACPVDPAGMAGHLAEADLALVAMGVTVYEALASGVPPVVVCRTRGDVVHARGLAARGALVSLGLHPSEEAVAAAVEGLLASPARREAMAAAGRACVDGRGAERVADRLRALLGRERVGEEAEGDVAWR